jgi:hypothetical protein
MRTELTLIVIASDALDSAACCLELMMTDTIQ